MKTLVLMLAMMLAGCMAAGAKAKTTLDMDTVIAVDGKRIEISEVNDRMKVRIYTPQEYEGELEDVMVFEGHYIDGKSYEKRKFLGNVSLPGRRQHHKHSRYFSPHWAGIGMGFANFADGSLHINDIDGLDLRSGKSLEYNINFYEKAFPFSVYNWAFVTGAGIRWSRYRLNGNVHLEEIDKVTRLVPAPDGINYKASKLNITSLTVPLLLEWQKSHRGSSKYFFSAGAVGVVKTMSSSKIVYRNENGKKKKEKVDGGMNIHPVTVDFLLQAGVKWIGVYAKYSPMELFANDRGPAVHPVSLGLHIHF